MTERTNKSDDSVQKSASFAFLVISLSLIQSFSFGWWDFNNSFKLFSTNRTAKRL